MAGKTILNQNIIDRVIEHTLKGISIESVCALSNISPRSYHRWIKQGKEDIENGVDSILAVLAESVLAAEAKVEQRLLEKAGGCDPICARWYLSRKFRVDSMCIKHITIQHYQLDQLADVHSVNHHLASTNTFE